MELKRRSFLKGLAVVCAAAPLQPILSSVASAKEIVEEPTVLNIEWESITDIPESFKLTLHEHSPHDIYGFDLVEHQLAELARKLI